MHICTKYISHTLKDMQHIKYNYIIKYNNISVLNFVANYGSSKAGFISQSVRILLITVASVNATAMIVPIKSPDGRQIRAFGHLSAPFARDLVPVWPHICRTTYLPACLLLLSACLPTYLLVFSPAYLRVVERINGVRC